MQIGVGGTFAILVIREVLTFVSKKSKPNGTSGEKDPAYWQMEFRDAVKQELQSHEGRIREIVREECGDKRK